MPIAYTTAEKDNTVTIDYNATLRLFLTQKEQLPFSPGKIMQMLNYRANEVSVRQSGVGLRIAMNEAYCVLTQQATTMLAHLYWRSRDLQAEYPGLLRLFAFAAEEGRGVCP